jgi:hypothetical protein
VAINTPQLLNFTIAQKLCDNIAVNGQLIVDLVYGTDRGFEYLIHWNIRHPVRVIHGGLIKDRGHIPGAINIPINHFNDNTLAEVVSKDQEIVVYCYGIQCDYSNQASNKALIWGYRKIYYFTKGFPV